MIAIVDDDQSVGRALRRLLRSLEMEAEPFAGGRAFLERLETQPSFRPDCVVLDIQMPDLNGIEVHNRLRRLRPSLPVIFITAYEDGESRDRASAGGVVACLRKPFSDTLFAQTLQAAFAQDPSSSTTER